MSLIVNLNLYAGQTSVFKYRTYKSLKKEWAVHNLCYNLHLFRSHTLLHFTLIDHSFSHPLLLIFTLIDHSLIILCYF